MTKSQTIGRKNFNCTDMNFKIGEGLISPSPLDMKVDILGIHVSLDKIGLNCDDNNPVTIQSAYDYVRNSVSQNGKKLIMAVESDHNSQFLNQQKHKYFLPNTIEARSLMNKVRTLIINRELIKEKMLFPVLKNEIKGAFKSTTLESMTNLFVVLASTIADLQNGYIDPAQVLVEISNTLTSSVTKVKPNDFEIEKEETLLLVGEPNEENNLTAIGCTWYKYIFSVKDYTMQKRSRSLIEYNIQQESMIFHEPKIFDDVYKLVIKSATEKLGR